MAPAGVLIWIESARRAQVAVPVPFLLLYAAVIFAAAFGGIRGGALAGLIASAYVIHSSAIGFGPPSLTGSVLPVSMGCLLYLISGVLVGLVREHRDRLLAHHRTNEARLEARVAARTQEVERAHQALRDATKMQALGQLTGGVAHEFNNLLTPILGHAALLHSAPALEAHPDLRKQAEQIEAAGERARVLIEQMLTFSRRGRDDAVRAVDISTQIRTALDLVRPMLPSNIRLGLVDRTSELTVMASPIDIQQAIINLCVNARDAIDGEGSIEIECVAPGSSDGPCSSCGGAINGQWCEVHVADTGRGMSPAVRERIFEPFFTTKTSSKGTGMGMAMIHGIVHACGGHIRVQPWHGGGTCVTLLLPLTAQIAIPATFDGAPEKEPQPSVAALSGRCILVVDDEPANVKLFEHYLSANGARLMAAVTPDDALSRLRDHGTAIDLLITDLTMPGLDGFALLKRARDHCPNLPAIVCSGYRDENTERAAAALERVVLLCKPVRQSDLIAAAETLLG